MSTKSEVMAELALGTGCLGKSADDEPVFVLCARDRSAPGLVRRWAFEAEVNGCRPGKVREALVLADQMEDWQARNLAKHPD